MLYFPSFPTPLHPAGALWLVVTNGQQYWVTKLRSRRVFSIHSPLTDIMQKSVNLKREKSYKDEVGFPKSSGRRLLADQKP